MHKKLVNHYIINLTITDQIFGNTSIASRIRIEDAHPVDKLLRS